ncbi:hypothetical protein AOPFMNJM_3623 [Methylobacterium jeotgali]|uniref:HTH arsR-type domain-containing protein n=3 Tax=Pseudomonadota TaxID=1224 RepID=A0ABQ4SZK6_9HYPH|nr:transcriptional regulator [Methylobacterium sp.]GJE08287.1 hypothetical protein AOPFMNJM_3623 [Methylobacterium jeotgali]
MDMESALSTRFAALADPTRRAILARLAEGEATVSELRKPFPISQPAISKHLRVLEQAGLIETGQDRQTRPRRLKAGALRDAAAWLGRIDALWSGRLDRLDEFLTRQTEE